MCDILFLFFVFCFLIYIHIHLYMYTTSQQPTRCIHQASDGQEATTCKKATSARAKPSLRRPGRGWRPGQTGQATQADHFFDFCFLLLMFILLVSECFVHTVVATPHRRFIGFNHWCYVRTTCALKKLWTRWPVGARRRGGFATVAEESLNASGEITSATSNVYICVHV